MRVRCRSLPVALLLGVLAFAGCIGDDETIVRPPLVGDGRDDVVVVAVLDWQLNPYHWDYLAAHMPQHKNDDPRDDLPLHEDPATWMPGFPERSAFASYDALNLTLTPDDPDAVPKWLYENDTAEWKKMKQTTAEEVHYRYIPGTKVIGFITTGAERDGFAVSSHGLGASSVSVGNLHGTCPSCLLVFVDIPGAAGEAWVRQQDWIDVTSHSYEASTTAVVRDNIRNCDTTLTRDAAVRGQQIFWAAGNGVENGFLTPQSTLVNCQKGPEWTITVGAVHPTTHASYLGHGKPVHVASVGNQYPRAGGRNVSDEATFSGTSNATPVTAGLYAEALHRLRVAARGETRGDDDGIILEGGGLACVTDAGCAVGDGKLTTHELRTAFFHAARPIDAYLQAGVELRDPGYGEAQLWTEGYGTFLGRLGEWETEVQRIVDHATGTQTRDVGAALADWMTAYSWCVQQVWGAWDHGHWQSGDPLPAADLLKWPQRSWMSSDACPTTVKAIVGR